MNESVIVKEYNFNKPLIQNVDSLIDNSIRDCYKKCFHTFDHICVYDINFENISNNQQVKFTISDKSMFSYENTYSNTNKIIIVRILVQILFFLKIKFSIQIGLRQFLFEVNRISLHREISL